jgi:sugar phosphate isomerase/epimerase
MFNIVRLTKGENAVDKLRISIQLRSLQMPFKKALLTASQLGAEGVEIDLRNDLPTGELSGTGLRQIRKMIDDLNLRVTAAAFPTRRGYNVVEQLDERVEATKKALHLAARLGTNVVVNSVGRIPPDQKGPEWDLLLQVLDDLGRVGMRAGAILAAETGAEDGPLLKSLLDAVPAGSLGVNLSPGQVLVNGFSALETTQVLGPFVTHVHATDGVRDLARGRGVETPLGMGSADFAEIVATLEQFDYRGFFTVAPRDPNTNVHTIRDAIEFLKSLQM